MTLTHFTRDKARVERGRAPPRVTQLMSWGHTILGVSVVVSSLVPHVNLVTLCKPVSL